MAAVTDPGNVFRKPASDWTDRELAAGIRAVVENRDSWARAGDAGGADRWNAVLAVLVEERRSWVLLDKATGEAVRFGAFAGSTTVDISDLVRLEDDDTNSA